MTRRWMASTIVIKTEITVSQVFPIFKMTTLDTILIARTASEANVVFGIFSAIVNKAGTIITFPAP